MIMYLSIIVYFKKNLPLYSIWGYLYLDFRRKGLKMNKKKRSLSESSDDPDDPGVFDPSPGSGYNPLAGGYNPSAGDYSSSGGLPGFKRPNFEGTGRA